MTALIHWNGILTLFVADEDIILSVDFWNPAGSWESLGLCWSEWLSVLTGLGCGKMMLTLQQFNNHIICYSLLLKTEFYYIIKVWSPMERSLFLTYIDFPNPFVIHGLASTFLWPLETSFKEALLYSIYLKKWRTVCWHFLHFRRPSQPVCNNSKCSLQKSESPSVLMTLLFQRRARNTILFDMETGKCKVAAAIAITLTLIICPWVIT